MDKLIRKIIENFVLSYPHRADTGWKKPLVAYASANDPLFKELKIVANPAHELPQDFLPEAKTVITYFIPFQDQVIESNKKNLLCSEAWAVSYLETNRLIADLNKHLQKLLFEKDYRAVYVPATHNFDEETLLSDWSHRSAAFIAGLGTFGVNHMLITEKGCCGRIGSLVTDLELPPTNRFNNELCLYYADGSCGKCASQCVNSALSTEKLDKHKCHEMLLINVELLKHLENTADVCGKCLVGLPCSYSIPDKNK